jgi:hypothetical protein
MTGRGAAGAWPMLVAGAAMSLMAAQHTGGAAPQHRGAADAEEDATAAVPALEREIEAAVVRGDVVFVDLALAPSFTFTHGDGWTSGGDPLRVDSRADWLATVAQAPYASRILDLRRGSS